MGVDYAATAITRMPADVDGGEAAGCAGFRDSVISISQSRLSYAARLSRRKQSLLPTR